MTKDTRIELRISKHEKTLLELACKMEETTISEVLRGAVTAFIDQVMTDEEEA